MTEGIIDYQEPTPKPSTTSKHVEDKLRQILIDVSSIEKVDGRYRPTLSVEDAQSAIQQLIDKQVLEERNKYRVLPPTVCPECGIKSGQMKRHLVKDHDYRYSEDSPNMPVKALQTNNKEK